MTDALKDSKIAFLGGGNMAGAIIGGLAIDRSNVTVSEPWDVNREKMAALGVRTTTSNVEASLGSDVLIISVKPQVTRTVCEELAAAWKDKGVTESGNRPVVVSIAAGITMDSLQRWLSSEGVSAPHIVRVMPNTPALVGEGASGLVASADVTAAEKDLVDALFKSVSRVTEWVDREQLLDVVTGLSGSGPAYFFAMVEHLIASATALGLSQEQATRLATQTCLGAGKMLKDSPESPAQLRKNVTSPNGTTYAGLQVLEQKGFEGIIDATVKAAASRAEELGKSLGKQ